MQKSSPGNVQKKESSEMLFADYGKTPSDSEDPTPENKRVIDLYEPVDAMCLNRERDRVVVAGIRGVLQIIKIQNVKGEAVEPPSIVKDLDMRVYRKGKVNILYSAQNVKWNQLYDQYIATTSSNGSIVCWNVSRRNKSVFKSHERSATCLDWHASTPYTLISGSRDCTVKSYDMRVKDSHQLTFSERNCESIRDLALCKAPGFDDYFFTGDDGGVVRLWDLRQTRRFIFQKVAHRSFVSTLSLNPHDRSLIATGGGRDKLVKIWEWTGPELNRVSVVETTAPLGRVVWRPDKPYHLATCASVNETTVHVWDVRRPYLPLVTYDEHRDSVTDACWPSNNQDVFLTCGKDGQVVLHNIDSGHAPISFACDVAFDITPDGMMGLAINSEIHAKNDAELEASVISTDGKKKSIRQIPYESFNKPIKSLVAFGVPEALTHSLPPTTFYKIAEKYVIGGVEIAQLCEKNSKIARKAGLEHVAQTWRLVEALCEQAHIQEEYDKLTAEEKERVIRAWAVRKKELAAEGRRWLSNLNDHYRDDVKRQVTQRLENTQHVTAFLKFSSSSESEDGNDIIGDGENNKEDVDRMKPNVDKNAVKTKKRKKKKKTTAAPSDFYFGAGEANFKGGKQEILHHNEYIGLRKEAYELRDVEKERRFFCKAKKQPTTAEEYDEIQKELLENEADFQAWSPMLEVYRILLYHAEQGDMQTCATITMVCGKRLMDAVDFYTINGWILCYIEMLDRLELYIVIAKIRKYCTIESISSVSRENTTIQLSHADCNALIVNGRCSRCESAVEADCTVCRFPIIGMTYQCNVCGHCMHADHAYQWFQKSTSCAFVGCPCTCGENLWPDIERTFIGNDEVQRAHRKFQNEESNDDEPSENRVDASRLDTDSEESQEEDLEWSPGTATVRQKFGEIPCEDWNTPWAQHLVNLVNARKEVYKNMKREEGMEEEKKDEDVDSDEAQYNDPNALSPTAQKDANDSLIRGAFLYSLQKEHEVHKKIIHSKPTEDPIIKRKPVKRKSFTSEKVENPHVKRRLERIIEEDEEGWDDDDSEERSAKKVKREVVKQEVVDDSDDEVTDVFQYQSWSVMKHAKRGNKLNAKGYIKSIGPIGIQSNPNYFKRPREAENERTTSPILTNAVRNHLASLNQNVVGSSSEDSDTDEELYNPYSFREVIRRETERHRMKKNAPKSFGEKAWDILNMSREELKERKAEKQRKRMKNQYNEWFASGTFRKVEVSTDEFTVSSLSDCSTSTESTSESSSDVHYSASKENDALSSSSSVSELFIPASETAQRNVGKGYKAEHESDLSSHEEMPAESIENALIATNDVDPKQEVPTLELASKFKKYKKKAVL
uniref:GATOR2 complex protein WDR24 n=1 Tax=Caenorhabditis tropicalis TaxID=1561998 RepID=A0A1I7TMQ3_9PELO